MSFERAGLALQNPDIQRALTAALAVLPRDETLAALPRAARQGPPVSHRLFGLHGCVYRLRTVGSGTRVRNKW